MTSRWMLTVPTVILLSACTEEPAGPVVGPPPPDIARAVYVFHEGNFGDPSGARLAIFDIDRDTVFRDVVEAANGGEHLGSLGDDMAIEDSLAYFVMSGSEEVKVLRLSDHLLLRSVALPGSTPHDILVDGARRRAYVTRLYRSSVLVVDLATLRAIDTIDVGSNPQGMALSGDRLFVCNSGYGSSNTVSVIDVTADSLIATIQVADGPTQAVSAPDGRLWVACTGNQFLDVPTPGRVAIINPTTLALEATVDVGGNLLGPIAIDPAGYAYVIAAPPGSFFGGPVHRIALTNRVVTEAFLAGAFYALAVESATGEVYVADVRAFQSDGELRRYTREGTLLRAVDVQRGPGTLRFRR